MDPLNDNSTNFYRSYLILSQAASFGPILMFVRRFVAQIHGKTIELELSLYFRSRKLGVWDKEVKWSLMPMQPPNGTFLQQTASPKHWKVKIGSPVRAVGDIKKVNKQRKLKFHHFTVNLFITSIVVSIGKMFSSHAVGCWIWPPSVESFHPRTEERYCAAIWYNVLKCALKRFTWCVEVQLLEKLQSVMKCIEICALSRWFSIYMSRFYQSFACSEVCMFEIFYFVNTHSLNNLHVLICHMYLKFE